MNQSLVENIIDIYNASSLKRREKQTQQNKEEAGLHPVCVFRIFKLQILRKYFFRT